MARTPRDAARYLDCVVGPDERDQFSLPHPGFKYEESLEGLPDGLRATWSADLGFGACASEVAKVARQAADALGRSGAFAWVDRAVALKDMSVASGIIGSPERWLRLGKFWPDRRDDMSPFLQFMMERTVEITDVSESARAIERRWENNQILAAVFQDVDLIVTPTTSTTAFAAEGPMPTSIDGRGIKPIHAITFTPAFNFSGHPAISIPCGFDFDGLPVGLQIVARRHNDHLLLALAAAFDRLGPWPKIATRYGE
jgi:Asp-tRNA(Asn)/Glu-tRNA(Gln) amidotransferase A subunit family amidase